MSDPKRALIVDDDTAIRTMLAKIVGRQNFDVETASDGVEAIERLEAGRYCVVVLDLMMPRVDGFQVLRHMRENQPETLSRTIVASAVPEAEVLRQLESPVFRIHPKPFELTQLIQDIRDCAAAE